MRKYGQKKKGLIPNEKKMSFLILLSFYTHFNVLHKWGEPRGPGGVGDVRGLLQVLGAF